MLSPSVVGPPVVCCPSPWAVVPSPIDGGLELYSPPEVAVPDAVGMSQVPSDGTVGYAGSLGRRRALKHRGNHRKEG